VITLNQVDKLLISANDKRILTKKNQSTNDIINQVLEQHKSNTIEAKRIAYLFDAGNAYGTCQNIWNFLKYNVPYVVEPSDRQSTKTLSRMLFDAKRGLGNDCKHYSGFTGAILAALGYKFKYRFTGYSDYIPTPTHVYCVCNENNNEIIIDAVLSGYNLEKPYKFKIDKKMSLYKLSGVENENYQISGFNFKNAFNNVKKSLKQAGDYAGDKARQAANYAKQETERIAKQALALSKTMGLAIPRNAFMLLIRFNVKGWATGLKNKTFNDLSWWANDWGGNRTEFLEAIKQGAKNKRILGFNNDDIIYPSTVGAIGEPVTIAAALATATPIIIKITDFLDKAQKVADKAEGFKKAADGFQKKADSIADTVRDAKNGFEKTTGIKVEDVIWQKETGKTGSKNSLDASDVKNTTPQDAKRVADAIVDKATGGGLKIDNKILMIGGAAALLAIVLLNKKK